MTSLAVTEEALDTLVPLDRNPRRGDLASLRESLRTHGQYQPIVVRRETREILAGNHRYYAAKAEGWEAISVVLLDVDEETAKRIALVDNRTSDLADYDQAILRELIVELGDTESGLLGTGYTLEDLEELDRILGGYGTPTDPDAEWVGMPEFDQADKKAAHSVTIHFPTHEDADRFFALIERDRTRSLWWPAGDGHKGSDVNARYVAVED